MLRIREEQIEHLDQGARRSLCDRLIGHVRQEMGAEAFAHPPLEARRRMEEILSEALALGLSWETHIAGYAVLRIAGGPGALDALGYRHNPQAPKAEIAEAFEAFLDGLPTPIWSGLDGA